MPADRRVTFACEAFDPADVDVHEVSGVEECSQLFHSHVVLAARDPGALDAVADDSKHVMNVRKNWRDTKQKEYEARAKANIGE